MNENNCKDDVNSVLRRLKNNLVAIVFKIRRFKENKN